MVYRGKPSKSCRQCRRRDIKCDKRKESCGQCLRANLTCPGYCDPSRVYFNDETEAVVRKVRSRSLVSTSPPPPPPERLLTPSVEDRAKNLFVSEYVYCRTAQFPFMEHFWLARAHHAHLTACVRAVSLAYMSFKLRSPEILQQARERYSLTLRLTKKALQCPQTATNNATLLTVLLLDMFDKCERMVLNIPDPTDSKHLDGALALLQLSGASQFDNDAVRVKLFRQVSMMTFMRSLRRGDDVPPELLALRRCISTTDREGRLDELVASFIALLGDVRKGRLGGPELDAEVKKLDDALLTVCLRPPKNTFAEAVTVQGDNKEFFIDLIEATSPVS